MFEILIQSKHNTSSLSIILQVNLLLLPSFYPLIKNDKKYQIIRQIVLLINNNK